MSTSCRIPQLRHYVDALDITAGSRSTFPALETEYSDWCWKYRQPNYALESRAVFIATKRFSVDVTYVWESINNRFYWEFKTPEDATLFTLMYS